MNKIYLFAVPTGRSSYGVIRDAEITGDVIGYALCEDGACIASHYSSGAYWARHDMGLTSDWKHEAYKKKYPDGYELEWIDYADLDGHSGYQAAYALNQAMPAE
jgi:hypothetical protein